MKPYEKEEIVLGNFQSNYLVWLGEEVGTPAVVHTTLVEHENILKDENMLTNEDIMNTPTFL